MIHDITTAEEFAEATALPLTVIKFWATWCVPCALFGPQFEGLSEAEDVPNATFLAVDVDAAPDIVLESGVRSVPTVQVWSGGTLLGKMSTSNVASLKKELEDYAAHSH